MFEWWHRVRDGTLAKTTFKRYMRPLRSRVEHLFEEGAGARVVRQDAPYLRTCARLLRAARALCSLH